MSDLVLYPVRFNSAACMAEIKKCIDIAFDILSDRMKYTLMRAIEQCSEAAMVMITEAQKNVKEISREITNDHATIEVGIDEGAIAGGEQAYVRVMVTLHGNGEVWARPGAVAWTKHVNSKRKNHVQTEYRLPFFEQQDHSSLMMLAFEHDINKHIKDFFDRLMGMIDAIDFSQFLI